MSRELKLILWPMGICAGLLMTTETRLERGILLVVILALILCLPRPKSHAWPHSPQMGKGSPDSDASENSAGQPDYVSPVEIPPSPEKRPAQNAAEKYAGGLVRPQGNLFRYSQPNDTSNARKSSTPSSPSA